MSPVVALVVALDSGSVTATRTEPHWPALESVSVAVAPPPGGHVAGATAVSTGGKAEMAEKS